MKNPYILAIILLNLFFLILFFFIGSYPWFVIILHILSLIVLFTYSVNISQLRKFISDRKDIILASLLFLIALIIRIYQIDIVTPGLQGDELIVAKSSLDILKGPFVPFIFNNHGHGALLPYLFGASLTIFGKSIFSLRLPSVIFGALTIVAFYVLLRLFLKKTGAFLGTFLFVFSYAHIVLSRLAFESSASIFFQVLTGIFLYLSIKTKNLRYAIGVGLALAIGNYTYLDFRVFTLIVLLILLVFTLHQKKTMPQKIYPFLLTIIVFVISAGPLIHYSTTHTREMTERTNEISIFNQGLTGGQIIGHVMANLQKAIYVFISPGDPNGRINPGNTAMFDFITVIFFLIGGTYLFRKQRILFYTLLFMFLAPMISDVFAKESGAAAGGPNDFNGFGHPNTMRIEGVIPLVIFISSFGTDYVRKLFEKFKIGFFIFAIVLFSALLNYINYFQQPFNGYTYTVNGVNELFVTDYINKNLQGKKVYLSPDLINSPFLQFFIHDKKNLYKFNPNSLDEAIAIINKSDATFIDRSTDINLITKLYQYQGSGLSNYSLTVRTVASQYLQDLIYTKN